MRKTTFKLLLLLAICCATPPASAGPAQDAAYKFIISQNFGRNLIDVGLGIAVASPAYKDIVKAVGEPAARSLTLEELKAVQPRYQDPWNRALADAYAKYFTAEEMNSLTAEREKSRYARKFVDHTNTVGAEVSSSSRPLIMAFANEGLNKAYARASKRR